MQDFGLDVSDAKNAELIRSHYNSPCRIRTVPLKILEHHAVFCRLLAKALHTRLIVKTTKRRMLSRSSKRKCANGSWKSKDTSTYFSVYVNANI